MKDPEDEAFEELTLKQGQWHHTSGNRKRQIMEREMNLSLKVPKAFPNVFWREDDGMDLRDYFAAKASEEDIKEHSVGRKSSNAVNRGTGLPYKKHEEVHYTREQAKYRYADAMLKTREA